MPELLLDKTICLRNIERMARKAADHRVSFRPHCKTHQSAEIAGWFRDFGVSKITVSSYPMAAYFAKNGWNDILVAFPFHPGDMKTMDQIGKECSVSVLLDNPETVSFLRRADRKMDYYIDIDTGYGRTGVRSDDITQLENIIRKAERIPALTFSGFYCHAGNSYKTVNNRQREEIHGKAIADLKELKSVFRAYSPMALYGDTPNCSTQNDFGGIDEITPGNFVFYDLAQRSIGSCETGNIAVSMLCPVVGKYNRGKRLLVHGGAVHFSKQTVNIGGRNVFGEVVRMDRNGWVELSPGCFLTGICQEHGILENSGQLFDTTRVGDKILILPPHSCLTANLMRKYKTLDGEIIHTFNSTV